MTGGSIMEGVLQPSGISKKSASQDLMVPSSILPFIGESFPLNGYGGEAVVNYAGRN
jgi:hypothetical protein